MIVTERPVIQPRPLEHQRPMLDSPARYKILPCGRRSGKTRAGLIGASAGHGPNRMWKGMSQGGIITWITPDMPQARDVWHHEMVPRFGNIPGIQISKTDKSITVPGGGYLEIRSMENIDSVRGGALDGVIFDEAAHMDLGYAWENVVRAKLADRIGWAMFLSTTNAGPDGNQLRIAPSYFNRLCASFAAGELNDSWGHWHWTIYDNPLIERDEIEEIKLSLGGDTSAVWQQEYMALLITGGAGLAFPEWDDTIHVVPNRTQFPSDWEWAATLDWGYRQGHYGLWGISTEGDVELVWEFYDQFTQRDASEAAQSIMQASQFLPLPRTICYDGQMDHDNGIRGMTLTSEWVDGLRKAFGGEMDYMPRMEPTVKGAGSRVIKKNIMHRFLAHGEAKDPVSGRLQPWARPRLRAEARCQGFIQTMKALPLDPNHPDDVDTKAKDHAYDSACMLLVTRPAAPDTRVPFVSQDILHAHDLGRTGRRRWETMQEEMQQPSSGSGYRMPREWREVG